MALKDPSGRERLSPAQETALGALMAGMTTAAAAEEARVNRSTVHRWLNDQKFKAEFNQRRSDHRNALNERLAQLQSRALERVEEAIDGGNAQIALAVLRGTGLLDGRPRPIGPGDPDRVARDQANDARQQELWDTLQDPDAADKYFATQRIIPGHDLFRSP